MHFGVFYEQQLPKPWRNGDEQRLFNESLEQIALADRVGVDYLWAAEHHFLDEYSHCSASDLLLAAAAARTSRIRIGLGIRQVIANYNHPARSAEVVATLDLLSNGRAEFGIGEGATRLELGGFGIPAKEKRAMSLEAAEQIANMLVMDPYPGYQGKSFSMPCRNVLPKPTQKPHPPMWMACTNRDTIKVAAQNGLGVLAFSFTDPEEASHWSRIYYDTIKSEECVPIGHRVNANLAMITAFSLHEDRDEAIARGQRNFEFFSYAMSALVREDTVPGRTQLWPRFVAERDTILETIRNADSGTMEGSLKSTPGIGTPADMVEHVRAMEEVGVDQLIFLQQAGRMQHEHICHSLDLFGRDVLPAFQQSRCERETRKARELAPYIKAAMKRKRPMQPLQDHQIPVVPASKPKLTENNQIQNNTPAAAAE